MKTLCNSMLLPSNDGNSFQWRCLCIEMVEHFSAFNFIYFIYISGIKKNWFHILLQDSCTYFTAAAKLYGKYFKIVLSFCQLILEAISWYWAAIFWVSNIPVVSWFLLVADGFLPLYYKSFFSFYYIWTFYKQ